MEFVQRGCAPRRDHVVARAVQGFATVELCTECSEWKLAPPCWGSDFLSGEQKFCGCCWDGRGVEWTGGRRGVRWILSDRPETAPKDCWRVSVSGKGRKRAWCARFVAEGFVHGVGGGERRVGDCLGRGVCGKCGKCATRGGVGVAARGGEGVPSDGRVREPARPFGVLEKVLACASLWAADWGRSLRVCWFSVVGDSVPCFAVFARGPLERYVGVHNCAAASGSPFYQRLGAIHCSS